MLLSHINAIERILVAQSKVAQNAGHPSLKGWPREWFVRDFLQTHLPSSLEIGHGEIIDRDSTPDPPQDGLRNEVDIVIYRNDLPKITYSRDNTAFLCEGVLATIEVKSVLTKEELKKACLASLKHKSLRRNPPLYALGDFPPDKIISYVIAYDCRSQVSTAANWLPDLSSELNSTAENMIDIIVILGKGVIWQKNKVPFISIPENTQWVYIEQAERNLFLLFTHLMSLSACLSSPPDTLEYGFKLFRAPYKIVEESSHES